MGSGAVGWETKTGKHARCSHLQPTVPRSGSCITSNIEKGDTFDSFIIDLEITSGIDLGPNAPYVGRCDRETCGIDPEMGPFIPDDIQEWLEISFPAFNYLRNMDRGLILDDEGNKISTWDGPGKITSDGSILQAHYYSYFEGTAYFTIGIVPGSTFRSYRTANPPSIVIEVEK